MQMPCWSWGGGSVIKAHCVSVKPGVWIPRIHINSRWASHPAHCLRKTEDPQNNLASKTNHIIKLWAWLKHLTSKKKVKSNWGWFLTWTSDFHIHSHPRAQAPTYINMHKHKRMQTGKHTKPIPKGEMHFEVCDSFLCIALARCVSDLCLICVQAPPPLTDNCSRL